MERFSGILLHPTSLPGKYGIGTLGKEAFHFIDFLAKARQKYWQILPLGPTGYADSPYQCFSSHAGNPFLIDLEDLADAGLITREDLQSADVFDDGPVDFGKVIQIKIPLLKKAFRTFRETAHEEVLIDFRNFINSISWWLDDYVLFMALKEHFGQKPWTLWDPSFKLKQEEAIRPLLPVLEESMNFHKFIQYIFFRQYFKVRDYAHQNNVSIIGDIPLYVAMDSADTWSHSELFQFDENKNPVSVGGVPPDYFSSTGQLWGNPIFRWDEMEKDGYSWWIERIQSSLQLYDIIRIDHFRGFAGYWSVPFGEKTAVRGEWIKGPGKKLFEKIRSQLGSIPIIAEDLGVITGDVIDLRDSFGLPGMKILQFAFDSSEANDYLPHNYSKNCVVYTGTHDNDTLLGWFSSASEKDRNHVLEYLHTDGKDICWDFIRAAWESVAYTAIVPMQDLLKLGKEGRMNTPGTTGGNWQWRAKQNDLNSELAEKLEKITILYGRSSRKH